MRHMARARPEQHAMQFSCRLHHQSVLARSRVHRARELLHRIAFSLSLFPRLFRSVPRIAVPLRPPVSSSATLSLSISVLLCFVLPRHLSYIGRGFFGN